MRKQLMPTHARVRLLHTEQTEDGTQQEEQSRVPPHLLLLAIREGSFRERGEQSLLRIGRGANKKQRKKAAIFLFRLNKLDISFY